MKIKETLQMEIKSELEELNKMEVGSDEYKAAVEGIGKLADRYIELEKIDADCEKHKQDLDEENLKWQRDHNQQKKEHKIDSMLKAAGIALPLAVTVWGAMKSWKFEETGTVASEAGKNFMNALLKLKK